MIHEKECKLRDCNKLVVPRPYPPESGSKKLNLSAWRRTKYCSTECGQIASSRIAAHQVRVKARFKRMCKARWERAFNRFVYGL